MIENLKALYVVLMIFLVYILNDRLDMVLENVIELDNGKKSKLESILLNGT